MADARALLRAERASRRITHPHASYSSDGKLLCNLCETLVKSEGQWQSHLHSTQHNLRSQRRQDAAATRGAGADGGAKKRKAESIESPPQERKKARAEPASQSEPTVDEDEAEAVVEDAPIGEPTQPNDTTAAEPTTKAADINPSDLAAFEQELASLEASAVREEAQARQEAATISAAPMTAEELAAQAREEQSKQRGRRDLELEEEREDAARVLEDEMEEMEGLEERVRRLRERRERLRGEGSPGDGIVDSGEAPAKVVERTDASGDVDEPRLGSDEDEDDDEDFDKWKFGGS